MLTTQAIAGGDFTRWPHRERCRHKTPDPGQPRISRNALPVPGPVEGA